MKRLLAITIGCLLLFSIVAYAEKASVAPDPLAFSKVTVEKLLEFQKQIDQLQKHIEELQQLQSLIVQVWASAKGIDLQAATYRIKPDMSGLMKVEAPK